MIKDMSLLRKIGVMMLFALLFALPGCSTDAFSAEDITGIWRPASFEEYRAMLHRRGSIVAVYITYDGNLFIHLTSETSIGEVTDTLHFGYEISGSGLTITPISGSRSYDMYAVNISVGSDTIRLDLRDASSFVDPSGLLFDLYRVDHEVPFGWADSDQQAMSDSIVWAIEEIHAFAERLGEALGLPMAQYEGMARTEARFVNQHIIPFVIEDMVIEIAFVGRAPTPTRPQSRHVWRGNPQIEYRSALNADRQLTFIYCWTNVNNIPDEWLDIVGSLY